MSPRQVELALKKQRLCLRSGSLRDNLGRYATAWMPLFDGADRLRDGLRWLRRHPLLPVAALVAALVARPRGVLRWAGRGWFAWQSLHRLRTALEVRLSGNR